MYLDIKFRTLTLLGKKYDLGWTKVFLNREHKNKTNKKPPRNPKNKILKN